MAIQSDRKLCDIVPMNALRRGMYALCTYSVRATAPGAARLAVDDTLGKMLV